MNVNNLLQSNSALRRFFLILGGIILYALALDLFLAGNNIAAGGISGIAIILTQYLPVSIGTLVFLMNVPILIAACLINGWRYTVGAILGAVAYSGAIEVFSALPTITDNPLVASVYGGVVYGAGMALLTLGNGSTGGTDLLSRLLVHHFPAMSMGKMSICTDGCIVLASMVAFGNIEVGLYAIITIAVCSIVADRIVLGFERGCIAMIITSMDAQAVSAPLMADLGRAVTKLAGTGMYSGGDRNVLLMAVRPSEVPKVKSMVQEVDANSFVILLPANELIGANFKIGSFGGQRR